MKRSYRLNFIVDVEAEDESDFNQIINNLNAIAYNSIDNGQVTSISNTDLLDYSISVNEVHIVDSQSQS